MFFCCFFFDKETYFISYFTFYIYIIINHQYSLIPFLSWFSNLSFSPSFPYKRQPESLCKQRQTLYFKLGSICMWILTWSCITRPKQRPAANAFKAMPLLHTITLHHIHQAGYWWHVTCYSVSKLQEQKVFKKLNFLEQLFTIL